MARDLNKVQFTGYLGADPDMRYLSDGTAVVNFRVASGRSWKDRDGNAHDDTEWFRVSAWNKLAEICNSYLTKGTRVYVEGRLQTRKWTDRDGQDRYTTEVIAQDMIILSSRRDREAPHVELEEREIFPDVEEPPPDTAPTPPPATGKKLATPRTRPAPIRNQPQDLSDDDIPF